MTKSLLQFFSAVALGAVLLVACGDGELQQQPGPECYENVDCDASAECSAGTCVAFTGCTTDANCTGGAACAAGICRAVCVDDSACGELVCDTVQGRCMPAANPTPGGTGGSDAVDGGTGGTFSASGGASGDGDVVGTGGSDPDPVPTDATFDLIDDLEDANNAILLTNGRIGYWYSYSENPERPLMSAPAASETGMAVHATGAHQDGVAADAAYGGIGVDLKNANLDSKQPASSSRLPLDASAWDGFQFKIKGPGVTKSVRFEVVTTAVATSAEGGVCSGDNCFDAFGRDVTLTTSWTTVKVPFSSLVQEGWGQAKTFDAKTILGLAWEDLTVNNWDFWLDDLEFYKDPVGGGGDVDPIPNACGDSWGDESNGSLTWYTFDQGTNAIGDVNCSYGITTGSGGNGDKVNNVATGAGTYFGAINTTDYNQAATCGACVEVTRDGGKSVVVTVVDQCPIGSNPKCVKGHIDLSKAAFLQLGTESEGYIGARAGKGTVAWKYVTCPSVGNVKFRLKEPSNVNWNMVIVENHTYPIASVQVFVDGVWVNASREEFNFWIPPGGRMGGAPFQVRAVDINGNMVEGSVPLAAGSQDAGEQFVCQ